MHHESNMYGFFGVNVIVFALHIFPQDFYEVAKFDKRTKLEELMQDPERDPKERTLIFVQTKKNADFLATYLSGEGLPTTSIHGDRCVLRDCAEASLQIAFRMLWCKLCPGFKERGRKLCSTCAQATSQSWW